MKICAECGTKVVSGFTLTKGDDWFLDRAPKSPKPVHRTAAELKIRVDGLKPGVPLFYFGSKPKPYSRLPIPGRDEAYGALSNSGVVVPDKSGQAWLFLDTPQVYYDPDRKGVFSRHFHFTYWEEKRGAWSYTFYTRQIFPDITQAEAKEMLVNKTHIFLNALSTEEYEKRHIAGSVSVPVGGHVTSASVKKAIMSVLPMYPRLYRAVQGGSLDWKDLPIVLYCYSAECSAAEHLKDKLDRLRINNTWHYTDGISVWRGPSKAGPEP
jgi:rhodanese-related sulfurtransferase